MNSHPSYLLLMTGLFFHQIPKALSKIIAILVPIITGAHIAILHSLNAEIVINIAGQKLHVLHFYPYSAIVILAFISALLIGATFAIGTSSLNKDIGPAFIYSGGAIAVVLAGDVITFFVMWEIMSIGSVILILNGGKRESRAAAYRYAIMHLIGGTLLLAGLVLYINLSNSLAIPSYVISWNDLFNLGYADNEKIAGVLILIGILINAAAPPFTSWLPDSYPEASPTGTIFLSTFTTKTAVFALLTFFAGSDILIYLGLFMIFHGLIYANLENNIRRMLSYIIINQVGFMLMAIGIGTELAQNGAALHLFASVIYKTLLFMTAASVIISTGREKFSELGRLHHSMKATTYCAIIGVMSLSAFPLTSGFISKSLSVEAAFGNINIWLLLVAASAAIFIAGGLNFIYPIFFGKSQENIVVKKCSKPIIFSTLLASIICIIPGLYPKTLYNLMPNKITYQPYTSSHIISQLGLLFGSAVVFFLLRTLMTKRERILIEFDWLYRVFASKIVSIILLLLEWIEKIAETLVVQIKKSVTAFFFNSNGYYNNRHASLSYIITNLVALLFIFLICIVFRDIAVYYW